jgi:hypothetical protein
MPARIGLDRGAGELVGDARQSSSRADVDSLGFHEAVAAIRNLTEYQFVHDVVDA